MAEPLQRVNLRLKTKLGLLLVVLLGFALRFRWFLLAAQIQMPLVSDAEGYMQGAVELLHFSYDIPREPAFSVVAAAFLMVFGVSVAAFRFSTVILGTLMIFLTYRACRSFSDTSTALLASLLVATDFALTWNSIRGLREELFSSLLLVSLMLMARIHGPTIRNSIIMGLVTSLLCLTKLEGFAVVLGVVAYYIWQYRMCGKKIDWKSITLILGLPVVVILAWFNFSTLAFQATTVQGSWWYAYEFGEGRRITFLEYLFRYHTPWQILFLATYGFARVLNTLARMWLLTPIGFGLLCLGFLYLMKNRSGMTLHFTLIPGIVVYCFFFGVSGGTDPRLLFPYLPVLYMMIATATKALYSTSRKCEQTKLKQYHLPTLMILFPMIIVAIHLAGYLTVFPLP